MTAKIVDLARYRSMIACRDDLVSWDERAGARASSVLGRQERLVTSSSCGAEGARKPRSEPRHEIDGWCSPRLTLNGKVAAIRNVSRHGLMAAVEITVDPGSRVLATLGGSRPISARVVWRDRGLVGLDLPVDWPTTVL